VPATGSHGTDLFETHAELPGLIVDWLVMTLIRTLGHAPADTLAAAPIIRELQTAGGAARVTELLRAARRQNSGAQLFPEITASIVGADYQRAGDVKSAIEVFELVLLAYPDSADAHGNLADAYLASTRWRCSMPMRYPPRHGRIPSRIAARYGAARRRSSKSSTAPERLTEALAFIITVIINNYNRPCDGRPSDTLEDPPSSGT
jgi:tetratricopeptide (TPR) repeat protein